MTPKAINAALDFIRDVIKNTKYTGKTYVAGGFVRDKVMGLTSHDIDLVVELPDGGIDLAVFIGEIIGKDPVVYPRFGTAMISLNGVEHNGQRLDGIDVECVYTRKETYTPGSRKPETSFGSLHDDVMRRDLTINSLLMDVSTGAILDLTGRGFMDIHNRLIDTTDDPDKIFRQDPLRMLRAVRFAKRFDFRTSRRVDDSLSKNKEEIKTLSKERIREEIEKMSLHNSIDAICSELEDSELLDQVFPGFPSHGDFHYHNMKDLCLEDQLGVFFHQEDDLEQQLQDLKFSNSSIQRAMLASKAFIASYIKKDVVECRRVGVKLVECGFESAFRIMIIDRHYANFDFRSVILNHPIADECAKGPTIFFKAKELMAMYNRGAGVWLGEFISMQRELWLHNPGITKDETMEEIKKLEKTNRAKKANKDV